jgi:hypothetical protein
VNKIIDVEGGIAMAGQVLLSISKDEIERSRLTSEYKFAVDLQSKMVDARRGGIEEVARNLLRRNRPVSEIVEDTGLTRQEIEGLYLKE